jgi:hypothetical protein
MAPTEAEIATSEREMPQVAEEMPPIEDEMPFLFMALITAWSLLDANQFYAYHFGVSQLWYIQVHLFDLLGAIEWNCIQSDDLHQSSILRDFINATPDFYIRELMTQIPYYQAVNTTEIEQERETQEDLIWRFSWFECRPQELMTYFTVDQLMQLYENIPKVIKLVSHVYRASDLRNRSNYRVARQRPVQQVTYPCPICRAAINQLELEAAHTDLCTDSCSICLHYPVNPCVTLCRHVFCFECINRCFVQPPHQR